MDFLQIVMVAGAPFVSFLVAMGLAYLDERCGTGKDLPNSRAALTAIVVLTVLLTYLYVFRTPLGAPILELLADGEGGSLIIFTGSVGIPLPLALLAILMLSIFCLAAAAGTALSLVLLADILLGLVSKGTSR